jgi:hypothetical protein
VDSDKVVDGSVGGHDNVGAVDHRAGFGVDAGVISALDPDGLGVCEYADAVHDQVPREAAEELEWVKLGLIPELERGPEGRPRRRKVWNALDGQAGFRSGGELLGQQAFACRGVVVVHNEVAIEGLKIAPDVKMVCEGADVRDRGEMALGREPGAFGAVQAAQRGIAVVEGGCDVGGGAAGFRRSRCRRNRGPRHPDPR